MRMTFILAACAFLISCATFTGSKPSDQTPKADESAAAANAPAAVNNENASAAPIAPPDLAGVVPASQNGEPEASTFNAPPSSPQASDSVAEAEAMPPKVEAQAAEHQEVQAQVNNEQRSNAELEGVGHENASSEAFYAGTKQPSAEVDQVVDQVVEPSGKVATELPGKRYSSASHYNGDSSGVSPRHKNSTHKKVAAKPLSKKARLAKIAKEKKAAKLAALKRKKSHLAKMDPKKAKLLAKKEKAKAAACKKIASKSKKTKKEIAQCKLDKKGKKIASKSKKIGKVAQANCQECNVR